MKKENIFRNKRKRPCWMFHHSASSLFKRSVNHTMTVSYTHLDVYKRQRSWRWGKMITAWKKAWSSPVTPISTAPTAIPAAGAWWTAAPPTRPWAASGTALFPSTWPCPWSASTTARAVSYTHLIPLCRHIVKNNDFFSRISLFLSY